MESRTRIVGMLALLTTGAALGLPAPGAQAGPDPVNQPLADGCQRNPVGLLTYTSPEWVFVGVTFTRRSAATKSATFSSGSLTR